MPLFLLLGQLVSHIALVYAFFAFDFTLWLIVLFMYFVGGCLGGSVTYHRLLSHRSWNAPRWWYAVGSLCGALFLIGSPLAWSNNHIAHHKYSDTHQDPHSPEHRQWWIAQWFSMLTSYPRVLRASLRNMTRFQTWLHRTYIPFHMIYAFTVCTLFGFDVLAAVHLVPSALIWSLASSVNTINHSKVKGNYTNYETKDKSQNNVLTGLLVWGEGWHNNHHAEPKNPRFGRKWWELDPSYWIIKLLEVK